MTPSTPAILALWRQRHVIRPVRDYDEDLGRYIERCAHDSMRVHPRVGGYRHDIGEIRALAAIERGEGIAW